MTRNKYSNKYSNKKLFALVFTLVGLIPVTLLSPTDANGQVVFKDHVTVKGNMIISKTNGVKLQNVNVGQKENARMRIKGGTYKGNVRGGSVVIDKAHIVQGEIGGPHKTPGQKGYEISDKEKVIAKGANLEVSDDLSISAPEQVQLEGSIKVDGNLDVHSQTVEFSAGRQTRESRESKSKSGGFLETSKRTSEHREKHDTAVPTHIEADSVHIKTDTLITEATRIKAARGIQFDARQWLNKAVQDHHCISDEVKRSNLLSSSHKVSGHCQTETVHTRLDPGEGVLSLNVQKVEATVGIEPGQSLSEALDHLVSTYPDLSWIAQLRNHHQVQWQTVENSYQEWDKKTSNISPLLGVIVATAVTVATQGMGASFLPAAMGSNLIATNAANAAFSTLVAKSAVDLARNGGDIGQTAKQFFSEDTIKTVAIDTIAGGLMGAANTPYLVSPSAPLAQRIKAFGVRTASRTGAGMVVQGGSLEEQLSSSLRREAWQELAAQANYWAGDYASSQGWKEGEPAKVALHSCVGAVLGELKDGKPLVGAVAGGAAQATAGITEDLSHEVQEVTSTIVAAVAAQLTGGDPQTGAWIGQTQHQYNRELHREEARFLQGQIEGLDEEQQARWLAAVCAKVRCASGINPDDPHYKTFEALEQAGSDYTTELNQLETSGLFTYTRKDATEDFLSRHDEGITRFTGIVQTLAGAGSAAGSAAGGAVLCVSGVGCGLGALISAAGMTAGIEEYREGFVKLTTEYTQEQGDRVAASFDPNTHPGELSRVDELGRAAVVAAAELAVGRLGLRLEKIKGGMPSKSKEVVEDSARIKHISGAREMSVKEYMKREKWALEEYDKIRRSTTDTSDIAKNLKIEEFRVKNVKDHLFVREHKMRDGNIRRFDPDPDIAETWNRLRSNQYTEKDLQLFKHEAFESRFESIHKTDYGTAHDKTQMRYPSPLD